KSVVLCEDGPRVPSIHDQQIVSEFPDVFPDELPGIPPVHEEPIAWKLTTVFMKENVRTKRTEIRTWNE
nr:hypothetical protein [Tanacetum cinerariifolium]